MEGEAEWFCNRVLTGRSQKGRGSIPPPSAVVDARKVERLVVAQDLAGSNPVDHPILVR